MAGRYILIEFDSEEQANNLRAKIDAASRAGRSYRVVGIFAKPGPTFCRCGNWTTARGQKATTRIGRKFGWVVCTECKKPAPFISFLRNILKPEEIINPTTHDSLDGKRKLTWYFQGISAPEKGL